VVSVNRVSVNRGGPLENRLKFHAIKYIYKATNDLASINSLNFFQNKPKINKRSVKITKC
jgi:hypothetical protein